MYRIPAVALLLTTTSVSAADFDARMEAYERGNYATVVRKFQPLAEEGLGRGAIQLGGSICQRRGGDGDVEQAVHWLGKAAEQGAETAQLNLGRMYAAGRGVPEDEAEAAVQYGKVAEQGLPTAQNILSFMYANGRGVPQNDERAAAACNPDG